MPENEIYGTFGGRVITDADIEAMADEAEAGYDLTKLRRRPGRPPTGSASADVVPARLDPEHGEAIQQRADLDDRTPS